MAPNRYVYWWSRTQRPAPHVRTLHHHGAARPGLPGFLRAIQALPRQWYHHQRWGQDFQVKGQRGANATTKAPTGEAKRAQHLAIKHVTEHIAALKYNTAIAALMEYLNTLEASQNITRKELETLLQLLAPFAPYITEELWDHLGNRKSIHISSWPRFDPESIRPVTITIPVQVNGRVRDHIVIASDTPEDEIKRLALATEQVQRFTANQNVLKVIY